VVKKMVAGFYSWRHDKLVERAEVVRRKGGDGVEKGHSLHKFQAKVTERDRLIARAEKYKKKTKKYKPITSNSHWNITSEG